MVARKTVAILVATIAGVGTTATATSSAVARSTPASALVAGQVLNGSTPVSGASVTLTAWPNQDVLAKLPGGATVPVVTIAATRADATGKYSLSPDLSALGASYRDSDGAVNTELDTVAGSLTQTYALPAAVPGSPAASYSALAVTTAHPASITFNPARAAVTTRLGGVVKTQALAAARVSMRPAASTATRLSAVSAAVHVSYCGPWSATSSYIYNRNEHFVDLWTNASASVVVEQSLSSSHTLGVAINIANGGWGVDGHTTLETHIGSGGSQPYSSSGHLYNKVEYRHFKRQCYDDSTFPAKVFNEDQVRGAGFNDIFSAKTAIGVEPFIYCATHSAGFIAYKNQGSNAEFGKGVSLPMISVSSQANYSRDTAITWTFKHQDQICGSNRSGWLLAPQAGVRYYKDPFGT